MSLFIEFLTQQWYLVGALAVCIILLLNHESRRGGPKLSPQQVINRVNGEQAVVLDLREPKEFATGHIVDAINIPNAKLNDRLAELESYRDKLIVLVCKTGQTASAAGKLLRSNGFENVARLDGGMTEWDNSQLPRVTK